MALSILLLFYIASPVNTSPITRLDQGYGIRIENYSFCLGLGFQSFFREGVPFIYAGGTGSQVDNIWSWGGYNENLIRETFSSLNGSLPGFNFLKKFNLNGDIFAVRYDSAQFYIFDKSKAIQNDPFFTISDPNSVIEIPNSELNGGAMASTNSLVTSLGSSYQGSFAII
jgi:hypothetical protein